MTISNISSTALQYRTLQKIQSDYAKSVTEASTGRLADVGLSLGRLTGNAVNYRVQENSFDSQLTTNKSVASRLSLLDKSMTAVLNNATDLKSSALVAKNYAKYTELATSALQQMQGALNTTDGSSYIFGGQAIDKAPMPAVDKGLAAAQANYDSFVANVGGGNPASITADQMTAYLGETGLTFGGTTYRFLDTVAEPSWSTNWSKASTAVTTASISSSESVDTSASASNDAFKKLTAGYAMLAVVDISKLGGLTKDAASEAAAKTLTAGTDKLTTLQAVNGMRQTRVEAADTILTSQKDVVAKAYADLEGVDYAEASEKMNALKTQLDIAMATTAKLQGISILDYV